MGRCGNEATFYHIQARLLQNVRISQFSFLFDCLHTLHIHSKSPNNLFVRKSESFVTQLTMQTILLPFLCGKYIVPYSGKFRQCKFLLKCLQTLQNKFRSFIFAEHKPFKPHPWMQSVFLVCEGSDSSFFLLGGDSGVLLQLELPH